MIKALWTVLRIVLTIATGGALVVGAVLTLVPAVTAIEQGNPFHFLLAVASGFATLLLVWLLGKGVTTCKKRANDLAITEQTEAIRLDPVDASTNCQRGHARFQWRQFAKAIAHYDAAIRLDPTIPEAYVGRVNAYGAIGQFGRVIAEYAEAIRLDPNHALAYCAQATAFNGMGRFDRSIPGATEAIRLAPDLYLGYDARGYGYLQRGSFNPLVKLVAIGWMLVSFGYLRREHFDWRTPTGSKSDFEQAVADFTAAIRIKPTATDCCDGRAQAYLALGQHANAAADAAKVRELL